MPKYRIKGMPGASDTPRRGGERQREGGRESDREREGERERERWGKGKL